MRLFLLLIFFTGNYFAVAQEAFLVFKKKNQTLRTYMRGSYMQLTHRNGSQVNGEVLKIAKDSIYLRNYFVQRLANDKGFVFFDTIYSGITPLHVNNVKSIYVAKRGFSFKASEYTSYAAAGLFSVLAVVNGIKFNDGLSTTYKQVAIRGGSLFLLGRLFHLLGREDFKMGKKYRLVTII
jgi:hypothetical protein